MNPSSSSDGRETPERSAPALHPSNPTEVGRLPRIGAPRLRTLQSKSRLDSLPSELLAQGRAGLGRGRLAQRRRAAPPGRCHPRSRQINANCALLQKIAARKK